MSKKRILSLLAVLVMVISLVAVAVSVNVSAADAKAIDYESLIPSDKPAEKYPFALFNNNGEYVGVYTHWANTDDADITKEVTQDDGSKVKVDCGTDDNRDVLQVAKDKAGTGKTAYVYLRRNYTLDSTTYSQKDGTWQNESFNNLSQIKGTVVLDLGNHTLTLGAKTFLASSGKTNYDSKFRLENGTLVLNNQALISYESTTGLKDVDKAFDYEFKNVTFVAPTESKSLVAVGNMKSTKNLTADVSFDNCTFDYSNVASAAFTLFNGNKDKFYMDVTIKGGNLITNSEAYSKITFTKIGKNDSFNFVADENGNMMTLTCPTNNVPVFSKIATAAGNMYFVKKGENKENATSTYEISLASLEDLAAEEYPFFVYSNGKLVEVGGSWQHAIQRANALTNKAGTEAVILMRRDYDITTTTKPDDSLGTIIVDLNGYTLTAKSARIFDIHVNFTDVTDEFMARETVVLFKNGTIVNKSVGSKGTSTNDPAIVLGSKKFDETKGQRTYTFNFEDLTIKTVDARAIVDTWGTSDHNGNGHIIKSTFTNCTFDLTETTKSTPIFRVSNAMSVGHVSFIGCSVIANESFNNHNLYQINNPAGSAKFSATSGEYLTLVQPDGAAAPTVEYTSADGKTLGFVKVAVEDGKATYVLTEAGFNTYLPKMSLTLDSNLAVNVYIPVLGTQSFTFNGVNSADDADLVANVVELDGVSYYLVSVALPASEAAKTLTLTANVAFGEKSATGSFTFSIAKYVSKLLASDATTTEEKTLAYDVLAYIKAAYTYFATGETADIDAVLGDYEARFYTVNGVSKNLESLKGATFVLDSTPAIRFFLPDGANAADYTFKQGGTVLECTVSDDLTYIDVSLYAHRMIKPIDYYVGDVKVGTYHINTYYDYVTGKGDDAYAGADKEALIDIVEKFYIYCKSAESYRRAFVGEAPLCEHVFENGTCTLCGEKDLDVGTMTINAPASIYTNYAGKDISVSFSKSWYNGDVTYTTDNENVFVENGKIFAKGDFASAVNVTITATTADHTATATVNVSTFNGAGRDISVEKKVQYYETNLIKEENKGGMIFVGDSYFDGSSETPSFWKDFYEDYAGEKAFLMGISQSQITELEVVSERIVYPMEPSEIVVHIGFNDVHTGKLPVDELIARITALLNEYHEKLPEAKIYFCGVEPKKNGYASGDTYYESSTVKAPAVTAAMQALAAENDWLYFVDTLTIFVEGYETEGINGKINKNFYLSTDLSHPTLYAYDLIRLALNEQRGVVDEDVVKFEDLGSTLVSCPSFTDAAGNALVNNYVISGKLAITDYSSGANVYVQFRFASGDKDQRFVLWDKDGNGTYGVGYITKNSGSVSDATSGAMILDGKNGLALDWAIVVKEGKAYWYINGNLVQKFESPNLAYFNIGVAQLNATIYDIELSVQSDNEAAYNEHVARYMEQSIVINKYGDSTDVNASGRTLTDTAGNALTDNYMARGTLTISRSNKADKSNAHLQFRFNQNNRFVLWDNNNDGVFGAGKIENKTSTNDTASGVTLYDANDGLTLEWAVIVKDGVAYWYVNDVLVQTINSTTAFTYFNIGALQMDVVISDIELYIMAENANLYNKAVSEYLG